jgi:HSP20 family molecular chaperone IbpA
VVRNVFQSNSYRNIYLETGHFERRISFGYDADLSQVRAEFDGEILRVIVPRRTPALTWYGGACE